MIALKAFYALIPKWLALALVAILLVTSGWCWTKMKYYQTQYKSVQADNVIFKANEVVYKNNEAVLKSSLSICQNSLLANAANCKAQAAVTTDTQNYRKQVSQICVKEDPNAKTSIIDAVALSNKLSARMSTPAASPVNH
jgi:hypothetical protein